MDLFSAMLVKGVVLGLWAVGSLAAIGATVTVLKDWAVLNWNWMFSR
jgi:hypothetical protein